MTDSIQLSGVRGLNGIAPLFEGRDSRVSRMPERERREFQWLESWGQEQFGDKDFGDKLLVSRWLSESLKRPHEEVWSNYEGLLGRVFGQGVGSAQAYDMLVADYAGRDRAGAEAVAKREGQAARGRLLYVPEQSVRTAGEMYARGGWQGLAGASSQISSLLPRGPAAGGLRWVSDYFYRVAEAQDGYWGVDPEFRESFLGQLAAGVGSVGTGVTAGFLGMYVGGAVGGLAGGGAGGGVGGLAGGLAGAALGSFLAMESVIFGEVEAERRALARERGEVYDPREALAVNANSAVPQAMLERFLGVDKLALRLLRSGALKGVGRGAAGQWAKRTLSTSGQESFEELAQGAWHDFVASQTYDDGREVLTGAGLKSRFMEASIGGIIGVGLGGAGHYIELRSGTAVQGDEQAKKAAGRRAVEQAGLTDKVLSVLKDEVLSGEQAGDGLIVVEADVGGLVTGSDGGQLTGLGFKLLRSQNTDAQLREVSRSEQLGDLLVAAANGDAQAQAQYNELVREKAMVPLEGAVGHSHRVRVDGERVFLEELGDDGGLVGEPLELDLSNAEGMRMLVAVQQARAVRHGQDVELGQLEQEAREQLSEEASAVAVAQEALGVAYDQLSVAAAQLGHAQEQLEKAAKHARNTAGASNHGRYKERYDAALAEFGQAQERYDAALEEQERLEASRVAAFRDREALRGVRALRAVQLRQAQQAAVQAVEQAAREEARARAAGLEREAHRAQVLEWAQDVMAGFGWKGPVLRVVPSAAGLPALAREQQARALEQAGGEGLGAVEGAFIDGKVYLVADQLRSVEDVARVLAHEVLGHYGLRGAFGMRLAVVLAQLVKLRPELVAAKLREYGLADTVDNRAVAAEEVLADLAQGQPDLGLVQRAIAAIRRWLRDLGFGLRLSDADIVANFIVPAREWVQAQAGGPVASIRGDEIAPLDVGVEVLRESALKWYSEHLRGRKVTNLESGRGVEFRGARKAFHTSANPEKLRLFAVLEQVIKHGQFKSSAAPGDSKAEPTARAYHWLEAQVQLGGRTVRLGVTIREDADGNLYYNHNEIKKAPSSTHAAPPHKGGGGIEVSALSRSKVRGGGGVNLEILEDAGEGGAQSVRFARARHGTLHKGIEKEGGALFSRAKVLQGEPVAQLRGDEAPAGGGFKAVREWAVKLFAEQGGIAVNPDLGEVELGPSSVRNSLGHGGADRLKAAAFAAVKRVVEDGALILSAKHSDTGKSHYVAAPVRIGEIDTIVTVLVRADLNGQRMYLHSVTPKENLLNSALIPSSGETARSSLKSDKASSGDVRNVLRGLLSVKPDEEQGAAGVRALFSRAKREADAGQVVQPVKLELEGWDGSASELAALARRVYTEELQGTSVDNASLGAKVAFTSEGKSEAFGPGGKMRSPVRVQLVRSLRDLVAGAIKVAESAPTKGRQKDSKAFHTLVNALEVGGQVLPVKLTVREAKLVPEGTPAHKFYDVSLPKEGSTGTVHGLGDVVASLDPASAGASGVKVGELAAGFKINLSEGGEGAGEPRFSRGEVEGGGRGGVSAETLFEAHGVAQTVDQELRARADRIRALRMQIAEGEHEAAGEQLSAAPSPKASATREANLLSALARKADHVFEPVARRLEKINPVLGQRLRRFEFEAALEYKAAFARLGVGDGEPGVIGAGGVAGQIALGRSGRVFMEGLVRLSKVAPGDYAALRVALANGDALGRERVLAKHGLLEGWGAVSGLLDGLHEQLREGGFKLGWLEQYYPRRVVDMDGLMAHLEERRRAGDPVAVSVFAGIDAASVDGRSAQDVFRELVGGSLELPGNFKRRVILRVDQEMLKFYASPMESLERYVRDVSEALSAAKLFGEDAMFTRDGEQVQASAGHEGWLFGLSLEGSIKRLVERWRLEAGLTLEQAGTVHDVLTARFARGSMNRKLGKLRDLSVLTTLGHYTATLTQLGDLAFSMYEAGVWNTLVETRFAGVGRKGAVQGKRVRKEDVGIDLVSEEFRDMEGLSRAIRWVFNKTGFEHLDRVGKEAIMNAKLRQMRGEVLGGGGLNEKSKALLDASFAEDARARVLDDLRAGRKTADTLFLAYSTLANFQPVSRSEFPVGYLENPNGRVLYLLKSFTVKAISALRREGITEIVHAKDAAGVARGFAKLLRLAGLMLVAGVPVDALKDWLMGRAVTFEDLLVDNLWKLVGINRWVTWRFREGEWVEAGMNILGPPLPWLQQPAKDVVNFRSELRRFGLAGALRRLESWKLLPMVGRAWYWHLGKGADKEAAKARGRGLGAVTTGGFNGW